MSIRVLIADPDEYLANSYKEYLKLCGFEVQVAKNALDCVEQLRCQEFDILVLEPSIPWGYGDGILAVMADEGEIRQVPTIVLTYVYDWAMLYRLAPYEIHDFLTKPLAPKKLYERITKLINRLNRKKLVGK